MQGVAPAPAATGGLSSSRFFRCAIAFPTGTGGVLVGLGKATVNLDGFDVGIRTGGLKDLLENPFLRPSVEPLVEKWTLMGLPTISYATSASTASRQPKGRVLSSALLQ